MEGDARSTTHPIQQPVATEAGEGEQRFRRHHLRKGMSLFAMLESFLGEENGSAMAIRNTWRAQILECDHGRSLNALAEASGKPVAQIAAAWTQQPGLPIVKGRGIRVEKSPLTQERFTVHFDKAPALNGRFPSPSRFLASRRRGPAQTSKSMELPNASGATRDQVERQAREIPRPVRRGSWKTAPGGFDEAQAFPTGPICSRWVALVQANRAPMSLYLDLVEKLPPKRSWRSANRSSMCSISSNRLLAAEPQREQFQKYARSYFAPKLRGSRLGAEKQRNRRNSDRFRASLIRALGDLDDKEIVAGCRAAFRNISPTRNHSRLICDLSVLAVVGRYADEATLDQAPRARPENDEHRGETELLRRARQYDRSEAGGAALGNFAPVTNCRPAARHTWWQRSAGKASARK